MSDTPAISVIIPTLNRAEALRQVLDYFLVREPFRDFELILIDQSAEYNAEPEQLAAGSGIPLRYVHADFRQTTRARNLGVSLARAELIVFSEDDVEPWPGLLQTYWQFFQNPNHLAATGPVLLPGQPLRKREELKSEELGRLLNHRSMAFNIDFEFDAQFGAGGNSAYRRSVIERAGGFDEAFVGNAWGEEYEFGYRVRQRSGAIRYLPTAGVIHYALATGGSRMAPRPEYIRDFVANTLYATERAQMDGAEYPALLWHTFRRLVVNRSNLLSLRLFSPFCAFLRGVIAGLHAIRHNPRL